MSNYFFQISFHWLSIYKILNIPEEDYGYLNFEKEYYSNSCNGNNSNPQINNNGIASFEYYVMPRAQRGGYPSSHIFCQQKKIFLETLNIAYRGVKTGKSKDGKAVILSCGFTKYAMSGKSGFWINFQKETTHLDAELKTLFFVFDEKKLNIANAYSQHGKTIPYKAFLIEDTIQGRRHEAKVTELTGPTKSEDEFLWMQVSIQSLQDAQAVPFASYL